MDFRLGNHHAMQFTMPKLLSASMRELSSGGSWCREPSVGIFPSYMLTTVSGKM